MAEHQSKSGQHGYTHEFEQIENVLIDIKARIYAFEVKSRASIQDDRSTMLSELQRSVNSVEGTIHYLNSNYSHLTSSLESGALTLSVRTTTSQALVSKHLNDMDVAFTSLHTAASTGLERVEHIKKTCDELEGELAGLRSRLASLNSRNGTALTSARQALAAKKTEAGEARTVLDSTRAGLQTLESKMEHRKLGRNLLRGARIATWTASVVFPPAVATAGGLEYIAHKMRHRLKELQEEIDSTNIRLSTLTLEVSTLEGRVASLEQILANTRSLGARVDTLEADSTGVKTLVDEQLREYQALKESTDDFAAWTRSVADETASMRLIGLDSRTALRRTTGQVVERLLGREHGDVRAICGKLERLELAPS
ncbi:unnamed protein product [Clonostachys rhizophaga]|uniref:Uncharacterized protein n=1 Tax=Clonostachys rhizophaga TaxID=160324 RepID=A0A9N9VLI5_9HYPO|nr:unnamed protein product [Clonostachys rhizophaga]